MQTNADTELYLYLSQDIVFEGRKYYAVRKKF